MEVKRRKLGEILLQMKLVSPEELRLALEDQARSPGKRLGAILIERGGTTSQALTSALGRQFMLPVAISDPLDVVTRNILRAKVSFPIRFALAPEEDILEALREAVSDPPPPPPAPAPAPASPGAATPLSINKLRAKHPLLGEMLLRAGAITQQQLSMVLVIQERARKRLGEILLSEGIITSSRLAEALSEQLKLPLLSLAEEEPEPEAIQLVPRNIAARLNLLPLRIEADGRLLIAMADPLDILAQDEVQMMVSGGIRIGVATQESIYQNLPRFYNR